MRDRRNATFGLNLEDSADPDEGTIVPRPDPPPRPTTRTRSQHSRWRLYRGRVPTAIRVALDQGDSDAVRQSFAEPSGSSSVSLGASHPECSRNPELGLDPATGGQRLLAVRVAPPANGASLADCPDVSDASRDFDAAGPASSRLADDRYEAVFVLDDLLGSMRKSSKLSSQERRKRSNDSRPRCSPASGLG